MKLLNLHIENFGKLSDVDIDLNNGTNVIFHENGWGKSTLAEFIRVMFYGLEGSRKKEYLENDRTRFQPWNGKHFGGELSFEANGKQYKIVRNLAGKDRDMTFKLYDLTTMLESSDYSEKIGEELFGVDCESFRKTCFVGGEGVKFNGINSVIGAKVSSVSQIGDLDNYDAAESKISAYLNANSPTRKTGELFKLKSLMNELKQNIKNKDSVADRISEIKRNRALSEEKIRELKEEQEKAVGLQKINAESKQTKLKLETLNNLKADVESRKLSLDERLQELPEEIPTPDMLDKANAMVQEFSELQAQKNIIDGVGESERFLELKRYFSFGIPDPDTIQNMINKVNNLQNLRQMNETYASLLESEEKRLAVEENNLKQKRQKVEFKKKMLLIAALVFFAVSIGCAIGYKVTGDTLCLGFACIAGVLGVIPLSVRGMTDSDINYYSFDTEHIDKYKHGIERNNKEIKDVEDIVKAFLLVHSLEYSEEKAEEYMYDIKLKSIEYIGLKKAIKDNSDLSEDLNIKLDEIADDLELLLEKMGLTGNEYSDEDIDEVSRNLNALSRSVYTYEHEVREYEKAQEKLRDYLEKNPDVEKIETGSVGEVPDEDYSVGIKEIASRISEQQELISRYDRELENAFEAMDAFSEAEERLSEMEAEYNERSDKYAIVEKTQNYLREAKELFIAKYMSPIKDSFDSYYNIISENGDVFRIDANVNLARKEEGEYHDIQAQSEGYGEAIGICMRLALLDTMYKNEKPFIVLDDPFFQMDETRLNGARKLMDAVAEKYQIIYMTCHESRAL